MRGRARLTPFGRLLLVNRIVKEGWTAAAAAESLGVSRAIAHKWVRRLRERAQRIAGSVLSPPVDLTRCHASRSTGSFGFAGARTRVRADTVLSAAIHVPRSIRCFGATGPLRLYHQTGNLSLLERIRASRGAPSFDDAIWDLQRAVERLSAYQPRENLANAYAYKARHTSDRIGREELLR